MKGVQLPDGRERLMRHGLGPERVIQTGIGPVEVRRVKLRDRGASEGAERIRFTSSILPRWARRTPSLDALLPNSLSARGLDGRFPGGARGAAGPRAPNLSPSVIARLRGEWEADYAGWQRRDLSARRYVYVWADGVYLQARMEPQAECILVLIGATPEGKKELVGFQVGMRESAQSWRELLVDLKARGLAIAPELATGDGALGFWKAIDEVSPTTRHQRCTVHKTANVLDKLPTSVQPAAKADLREYLDGAGSCDGRDGDHDVCREVSGQIREGGHLPGQGRRRVADLLRLPRRALGSPAHVQPDRERVRHGAAPNRPDQGRVVPGHRPAHGVQARHGRRRHLAQAEGREPVAQGRSRASHSETASSYQHASTERRLITASPRFQHSSDQPGGQPRRRRDEGDGDDWRRQFRLVIPVREPERFHRRKSRGRSPMH